MLNIFVVIACLIIIIFLVWRFLSNRVSLPCPSWLSMLVEMDNPFVKVHQAKNIIEILNISPGMSILDAGCGPGRVTIPAALKTGPSGEVTALDIQEGMLQKVREKAEKNNITNINYLQSGLGDNKLPANKFDRVIMVTVLGEIPDREAALKEIFNTLKSNGILSITEIIFDVHFLRRETVIKLAASVGFKKSAEFGNALGYTLHFIK